MPGTIIVGLIVVVWLFVLAPLVMKNHRPVHHAGAAFDQTRVVHEGGQSVATRRRPLVSAVRTDAADVDVEVLDDEAYLIDDHAEITGAGMSRVRRWFGRNHDTEILDEIEEADIVDTDEDPETEDAHSDDHLDELLAAAPAGDGVAADGTVELKDSYLSPADFGHPDADYGIIDDDVDDGAHDHHIDHDDEAEPADGETDPPAAVDDEDIASRVRTLAVALTHPDAGEQLTDEDREFAQKRLGRGGWDPAADEQRSLTRLQRRRIIVGSLLAAVVVTTIIAVIFGGQFWLSPLTAAIITALYLVALRRQVVAEQRLRRHRIRQMRRARLGVRTSHDEELGIPARLRRPGAVVVELDDESPDFVHLDTYDMATVAPDERDGTVVRLSDYASPRRAG